MTSSSGDPGVSNERTALAWQRTALSLVAASAVLARLTWARLELLGIAVLTATVALSLWVFFESRGRYAHDARTRARARPRGGRAPAAVAVATALVVVTELTALAQGSD